MITNAAIRINDQTHTGRSHAEIVFRIIADPLYDGAKMTEGFVDNKGNFLARREAADHAYECGQIKDGKFELFSYDLGWK